MRILSTAFALLLAVATAAPAFAGEAAEGGEAKKDAKKGGHEPGTNVEMPFLIAPIIVEGKLVGYAYISSKIVASSQTASAGIREKTPFLQDAFIRDVNATPIGKTDDPKTVDQPALVARLLADARRIVGSATVASFMITAIQVAPTRPNQT